jgi:hypothetical protein
MALSLSLMEGRGGEGGGQTSAAALVFIFCFCLPLLYLLAVLESSPRACPYFCVGVPFLLLFPSLSRFEWTLPLFGQQNELNFHLYFILLHL